MTEPARTPGELPVGTCVHSRWLVEMPSSAVGRSMPLFVLAHGSGVDDVLWFLVPVVVAMFVLRRAEKRARERAIDAEPVVDADK